LVENRFKSHLFGYGMRRAGDLCWLRFFASGFTVQAARADIPVPRHGEATQLFRA
jgi:hypothetical protein